MKGPALHENPVSQVRRFSPSRLIRPAISLVSVSILVAFINTTTIYQTISSVRLLPALLAIILHIVAYLIAASRWWLLLRSAETEISFRRLLPSYFLGLFLNNFLPSSLGGDAARVAHLRRWGPPTKLLIATSIVDRLIGLLTVTAIASLCLVLPVNLGIPPVERASMLTVSALSLILVATILLQSTHARLKCLLARPHLPRLLALPLEIILHTEPYARDRSSVYLAALVSVVAQLVLILAYCALGAAVGLNISPLAYFVVVPFAFLAGSAPISIGGAGIREAAITVLLIAIHVPPKDAAVFALLSVLVIIISTLPGALTLMPRNRLQHG